MTTRSAKLYQGEDKAPVVDYTDLVIWEESEFGTRAHNGEGSASNVVIRDPFGEQGSIVGLPAGLSYKALPSKSLFLIEVDTSILFRGRVGIKNYSRDGQHVERYRQVDVSLHDTHWDLDHIFVHQYSRPAETDVARTQGIIASYLSGNGRETTVLNGSNFISASNPVSLPAQEYLRTSPLGMLREVATSANKQFFVTGDTIGGGSLFWDGNDSTAYACPFTISDRPDEVAANPGTYFPPIWNVGPASTEDGSEQIDEIRYFYGSGDDSYVTVHSDIVHSQYGHASVTIYDDTAETAAEALVRAGSILSHRRREDRTYNVTIGPLTDAEVVQIKHGQTIPIKARAIPDADDAFQIMRIGQCRYTTPITGTWFAHLQLGRPWKMQPYVTGSPLGPKPPSEGTPGTPGDVTGSGGNSGSSGHAELPVTVGASQGGLYVAWLAPNHLTDITVEYQSNLADAGTRVEMDLLGSIEALATNHPNGGPTKLYVYHLADPVASHVTNGAQIDFTFTGAPNGNAFGYWVTDSDATPTLVTNRGTGTQYSVDSGAAAGDLVLDTGGWRIWSLADDSATPSAQSGQTTDWAVAHDGSAAQDDMAFAGGHKVGGGARAYSWSAVRHWVAAAIVIPGGGAGGDLPAPIGGGGDADNGDPNCYSGCGHVHEHGDQTDHGDETHHAASSIAFTPTGPITADNVQDAILEVGDIAADVSPAALAGKYLLAIHKDNGGTSEYIHLLTSPDGVTFTDVYDGEGLPGIGFGLRDASITRFDRAWWIIATGGAAGEFSLMRLRDGEDEWTLMDGVLIAGSPTQVWAPEWIRNLDGTPYLHPDTGFPCATVNVSLDDEATFTIRELHPTDREMTTWSSTTTITGTGLPTDAIDAALYVDGDDYWLWYHDESEQTIGILRGTALTSGYTVFESGDWAGWFAAKDGAAAGIEGPSLIRLPDGRWRVYFNENNGLNSIRVVYSDTTDDWRTGTSTWTEQAEIVTPSLMGHGTALWIPSMFDHMRDPHAHPDLIANSGLHDEPMVLPDGTVMLDGNGNPMMHEVAW